MTYLSLILNILKLLNWLTGWLEKQKNIQEGREEVINAINEEEKKADARSEELTKTSTDSTDAAVAQRMRDRSDRGGL